MKKRKEHKLKELQNNVYDILQTNKDIQYRKTEIDRFHIFTLYCTTGKKSTKIPKKKKREIINPYMYTKYRKFIN